MYRSHFGLIERPFAETLDPSWFLALPGHAGVLNRLRYGLESGPCVAVHGPSGTGKSLLARALAGDRGGSVVHLTYPALPPDELMASLAAQLAPGTSPVGRDLLAGSCPPPTAEGPARRAGGFPGEARVPAVSASLDRIRRALAAAAVEGRRPLLVVDDAHLIGDASGFESLRLLLNFATEGPPDLAILFLGAPDLPARMPDSLADRLAACCPLMPLTASETSAYLLGRLARAGAASPLFDPPAVQVLHRESDGLPRRLNRLADLALLVAFARGMTSADAECAARAAAEAGFERAA